LGGCNDLIQERNRANEMRLGMNMTNYNIYMGASQNNQNLVFHKI